MINRRREGVFLTHWRPAMAWSYLAICLWDFLLAPLFFVIWSYYSKTPYYPWKPLTLSESGLYHMSMGAIVGVATWSRGQEKMKTTSTSEPLPETK